MLVIALLIVCFILVLAQPIVAVASAPVSGDVARWFKSLEAYPERYRFLTHRGIKVVSGTIGDLGSVIETRECIGGVELTMRFEFVDVRADGFVIELCSLRGVTVAFAWSTELRVEVRTRGIARLLNFLSPFVATQIHEEVEHIAKNVLEARSVPI